MSVFARSDVRSVVITQTGHQHDRPTEGKGKDKAPVAIWELDCDACAPILLAEFPDQWAKRKEQIPLTPDEELERQAAQAEGQRAMEIAARGLGAHLAEVVTAGKTGVS